MNRPPSASSPVPAGAATSAQALALWRAGRSQEAQRLCELLADTGNADALSLLAEIHATQGRPDAARAALQRLSKRRPPDASVLRRLGNALLACGALAEAVPTYRRAIALEPRNMRAHNNLGQALMQLGRPLDAMVCYRRAVELDPSYALAHNNLGIALYAQGQYKESLECYQRALQTDPHLAEAQHNCGSVLLRLTRAAEALEHFDRALALRPHAVETLVGRGKALQQLERPEAALECYGIVLRQAPAHAEALSDCANTLLAQLRPEEALQFADRAVAANPNLVEAHSNRAGALRALHRCIEAQAACEHALSLKPDCAEAWSNLANINLALHRNAEAMECCQHAIELRPELAEAHSQLAGALYVEKRHDEALAAYARLQALQPQRKFLESAILGTRQACCDWRGFGQSCGRLRQAVETGGPIVAPMTLLAVVDDPALHRQCADAFAADQLPRQSRAGCSGERNRHDKIRVAYLSADFHQHATAVLAAGLFEAHDRSRFETMAVSFGPDDATPMRARLVRAFDRFIEVGGMSDGDVAQLMRSLEVDIAVDLKGYTGDCRPGILTRRAAPIQVQYLGYPGTMALEAVDYLIADEVVVPPEALAHYSERLVWLPESYQVNDDKRPIDERTPGRAELGLPEQGFVFCCFNNNHKITPPMFDVWMELLREMPGSVLWLLEDNAPAAGNLRREATVRGMDAQRLVFAPRLPTAQHLARHRVADLFLDTLPYNAHTTASDALWAGLPVLTCRGNSFAARVGASLLRAIGLESLVTVDLRAYRNLALALASDNTQLQQLRARLAANRLSCALFDTTRSCRHLERAYSMMCERYERGLEPENMRVPALV